MIYSPQVRSEGSPHPHRTPSPRLLLPACQCVNRAPDLMSQPSVQLRIAHDRVQPADIIGTSKVSSARSPTRHAILLSERGLSHARNERTTKAAAPVQHAGCATATVTK